MRALLIRFGLLVVLMPASHVTCAADQFPDDVHPGDVLLNIGHTSSFDNLGFGWSRPELYRGTRYSWINHLEADLLVELEADTPYEFFLWASPLYLKYRRQAVALYVNGTFHQEWICPDSPDYALYRVTLPRGLLRAGKNTFTFRMGYRKRGNDSRDLALRVERILFRKKEPSADREPP